MKLITRILFGSAAIIVTDAMKPPIRRRRLGSSEEKETEKVLKQKVLESIQNNDYKDVDGFISDGIKAAQLPGLNRGCTLIVGWAKVSPISPSFPDGTNVSKDDRDSLTRVVHNAIVTLDATSRYSLKLSWPKDHRNLKWTTNHNTLHMERLRLVPGKEHERYYLDVTKDQSLVYRLWFMDSVQQTAFRKTWHNYLRQYYPGKANDQTLEELDDLTDRYEELRRRNEELARLTDARRAPLSPKAMAELKAPTELSRQDLYNIFETEYGNTKINKKSHGLHIPQLRWMAVSKETILEIYERRMVEFRQMNKTGKLKPQYSYITNTFTCSDFARVFQACISQEQHYLSKKIDGGVIRFAFAEVWSGNHAYNAIVTKDREILLFEPQCGEFLTKDQIKTYACPKIQLAKF